ncbi:conserved domain protein [delta proteobacterium NaphS2]|nr:conserved domain protein [delta proteobacterium NaphS2]
MEIPWFLPCGTGELWSYHGPDKNERFRIPFSGNKKPRFGLRSGVLDALNHVLTSWFEREKITTTAFKDMIRIV